MTWAPRVGRPGAIDDAKAEIERAMSALAEARYSDDEPPGP